MVRFAPVTRLFHALFLPLLILAVVLTCALPGTAQAQFFGGGGGTAQSDSTGGDGSGSGGSGGDGSGSGGSESGSGDPTSALALQSLLNVLQDDAARQRLVSELEKVVNQGAGENGGDGSGEAGADASGGSGDAAQSEPLISVSDSPSLGSRIAQVTQDVAETLADQGAALIDSLSTGGNVLDGLSGEEFSVLLDTLRSLLLVIVITVAVYLGLRMLLVPLFNRMGHRAEQANVLRLILLFVGSTILDLMIVIVAWGLGYAITTLALGEFGQIDFRQVLYLNAFLLVELVKVAIRAIVAPAADGLRLVNLSNRAAKRLYRHINVVVSLLGYGQLLIVPVVNRNVSFAAGLGVSAILSVFVLLYLVFLVLRHSKTVANWIARRLTATDYSTEADDVPAPRNQLGGLLGTLVRSWHWFALIYLALMFLIVVSRPADVVVTYLVASGKVITAVLLGSLVVGAIGRGLQSGVSLPDEINRKLPLLERRINAIVPKLLIALRIVVTILVLGYTLNVLGITSIGAWISSDAGLNASGALISVLLILLVAAGIWLALNAWVDYRLNPDYGSAPTSRETTLLTLMRNALTIAILILTVMFCLSELGINIGPLLASAGVLGLAIGFGAQKMVQDIITGVFIQLDNAMNVGDVVTVGGTTGTVEKLTVRSVSLRALDGTFHIIPFSSVDMVSNYMRDFAYHLADMGIAYREDVDEAKQAMLDGFETLKASDDFGPLLLSDLEWFGLQTLGDSAVVLRARIKTLPGKQWGVGRAYNEILKKIFDERGIEIPYPHQTLFFGESKDGKTQALRLDRVDGKTVEGDATEVSDDTDTDTDTGSDDAAKAPTRDAPLDSDGDGRGDVEGEGR